MQVAHQFNAITPLAIIAVKIMDNQRYIHRQNDRLSTN
jgi:hypothetical protein